MLEDTDDGQLEDIDVIPNEEMLLVQEKTKIFMNISFPLLKYCCIICMCQFSVSFWQLIFLWVKFYQIFRPSVKRVMLSEWSQTPLLSKIVGQLVNQLGNWEWMIQCQTLLFVMHMTMSSTSGISNFSWCYYVIWLSFIN